MNYIIEELDKKTWQGHLVYFSYVSESVYNVDISSIENGFGISIVKKPLEEPFFKIDTKGDALFQPHWEGAEAYGIVTDKELRAVIELWVEEWSNRLRITELWIDKDYRRQGIGTKLINLAKEKAVQKDCRAIILETQSCNEPAISFYLSQGFTLIGLDACCYSNSDMAKNEVRLELGYLLEQA